MAQDKAALFALINNNLGDNTTGDITPQDVREVATQNADSALNTLESTLQTVSGPVNFAGTLQKGSKDVLVGGKVVEILRAGSTINQNPSGLGVPLQITFGAAVGVPADPVMMSAAGVLTFNQAGNYAIRVKVQVGRVGSTGVSRILTRALKNGAQAGIPDVTTISSSDAIDMKEVRVAFDALAGDVLVFQVARDPSGADAGGLVGFTATGALAAWGATDSAAIIVERFTGVTS